jgi:hypothetical protein
MGKDLNTFDMVVISPSLDLRGEYIENHSKSIIVFFFSEFPSLISIAFNAY